VASGSDATGARGRGGHTGRDSSRGARGRGLVFL
jgi:hypothetical protein